MTSPLRQRLAELSEALAAERDLCDRMRFKLVVMHLVCKGGSLSDREEARRHLEKAVNEVESSAAPDLRMIEDLGGGAGTTSLARLVDTADEPYRTMLADHVAWFRCLAAELAAGLEANALAGQDPLEPELEEVLYRAVCGALSGGAGMSLARYLRVGIHSFRAEEA